MAESAVSFLLNQLSVWLQQEQNLLQGLEQEVDYIQDELGHMKAFLRIADAKEENDPQLKEWIRQVRKITYDTEDILEKYLLRFAHQRYGANGFSCCIERIYTSVKNLKARHRIASEIQTIKSRVENVSRSQQRFRDMYATANQGSSSTPTSYEWYDGSRGDALLLEEADIVGIEKPKQQLLDWLLSANDGLKVISVVGMGGLGKTTVVKKVYDDTSVKAKFDCHVWVTVSASFKADHLLRNIINRLHSEGKQQSPQELEAMNVDDMKEFVYQFLRHKTYIIVLDDVWKIDAWESIRYAFPRSSNSGYIVITTRLSNIGNAACSETNGHVYNLQHLNAEESEKLFYKKAFARNLCPLYLKEISQSILKRCHGLPLAIVVIGGLLATKNNIYEEWQVFERNIGLEMQGGDLMRLTKLLSLSYYDLPYYLKSCFLYLSIFPEDALLKKWRIIRLWIAEGFVEEKQGKTAEEVAEGYLNELLNRSLIQVADTCYDGRPKKFRIHDILREYIILKSREHNVVAIISGEEGRLPDKIRQLAIHTAFKHAQESYNVKCLRSLLWLQSSDSKSGSTLSKILLDGCRLLKVLDVRGAPFIDSIPDEVFKLYHLKYLTLRRTNIKIIPKSIENLQNLEALDLKESRVTKLPIEILKLRKLRHLLVYSYNPVYNPYLFEGIRSFKAPYEIGRYLTNLQKLCYIDADEAGGIKTVKEIGKLTQLRRLRIIKLRREDGKDLCLSLAKLVNLRSLGISSIEGGEVMDLDHSLMSPSSLPVLLRKLVLRGCLEKVPKWVHSLNGLTELVLAWSRLREVPLQHLGILPNLVRFGMYASAYEGEELSFNSRGFQRLKQLELYSLRGLRRISVEDGSIPHLKELYISNCKLMSELPNGIEHLKDLQYAQFSTMSEEFVNGLGVQKGEEGEEWKLAHVPKVLVYDGDWEIPRGGNSGGSGSSRIGLGKFYEIFSPNSNEFGLSLD